MSVDEMEYPPRDVCGEEIWVQRFEEMGLPSFRPLYLFLVRIPLDVLHEALRLRLEQQPEADPSLLSVRQVIVILTFCSVTLGYIAAY